MTLKAESRRTKIAKARRGKPRPKHVKEALRKARLGKRFTAETRQKMSKSHRNRGTRPVWLNKAWEPWEDELLRKLPVDEVMQKTGRTRHAVHLRRRKLGLPDGRTRKWRKKVGRS